jgi:hypothetical protein
MSTSWAPTDLVSDVDLAAYEPEVVDWFARPGGWGDKRAKALEDWLFPRLAAQGFDAERLRTRAAAAAVLGATGAVWTDYTLASRDRTGGTVPLATVWTTPSTDALYVGHTRPFRGLSARLLDAVSSTASVLSVAAWADAWQPLALVDGTRVGNASWARGGAVTWRTPGEWVERPLEGVWAYWARCTVSAALTASTAATQIGVIQRSALCAPATFRTLELIYTEAPTGAPGPWREKAEYYGKQAIEAWALALPLIGREFDANADDVIDRTEAQQTTAQVTGGGWTLERA